VPLPTDLISRCWYYDAVATGMPRTGAHAILGRVAIPREVRTCQRVSHALAAAQRDVVTTAKVQMPGAARSW